MKNAVQTATLDLSETDPVIAGATLTDLASSNGAPIPTLHDQQLQWKWNQSFTVTLKPAGMFNPSVLNSSQNGDSFLTGTTTVKGNAGDRGEADYTVLSAKGMAGNTPPPPPPNTIIVDASSGNPWGQRAK